MVGEGGGRGIQWQFYVGLHTDYPLSLLCSKYYIWYLSKYYIDGWLASLLAGSAVISPNTSRPATAYSRYATLARDLICSTYLLLGPAYNQSLSPLSPQPTVPTQPQLIICSLQHIFSSLPTSFLHTSHLSSAADSDHQSRGGEGEGGG